MDKVRKVLEGKAVLRVVDIEVKKEVGIEERMRQLSLNTGLSKEDREVDASLVPAANAGPCKSSALFKSLF